MRRHLDPQDPAGPYLRSGQVAEQAGVNPQTLRYYERRGLIAEPRRSPGGHRAYPPETVTLLTVIKAAQRLGFTLEEVAELLDTGRRGHPTADLRERAQEKIAEVDARIADLTTIRSALSAVVSAGCDSLTHCTCPDCPLPYADLAEVGVTG
ncbi:MerR family transcriptional regulator [Nonomuraea cavernae]|uniref:MerR family transcriptional regulator n=1 Tax=Nonomuraea cavernae TaxID=2045107 RepID=A0A917ZHG2_9ACTN|nr:MerR family transcriptional regulator [Nonomuraea cavernae]MCA2190858.1 MerR family transcriptional regulator [Nonomuraea cavernae]GGO82868.1 MerR family transcriptional regulator [Nonomuraea cavernae]